METTWRQIIPPITHPLGRGWHQPDQKDILIDDTYAVMKADDLDRLPDYSFSQPTGVYTGKMWMTKYRGKYHLHWFRDSDDPNMCSHSIREILIIEP